MLMINGAFRGIAAGAPVSGGGGATGLLLSLDAGNSGNPLYQYWDFAGSFLGSFIFSDTDGDHPSSYTGWQRLGPGVTSSRVLATAQLGTHWFGEYTIPTLSASTNQNDWPIASLVQGHRSALNDPSTQPPPLAWDEPRIGGLYYDPSANDLYVTIIDSYGDVAADYNTVVYTTGDNIAASSVTGMYNNGGGRHAHGGIIPIPTEFQASDKLNGTHMVVSGGIMSIDESTTCGISVFVLPTIGSTSAVTAMDFPVATPMSALDPEDPGATLGESQMWNHLSCASGAFIYPNTRTLVVVGENIDLSVPGNYIIYHAYDDNGDFADGHNPYVHDSWVKYYWLIDIDDLIASIANPGANPVNAIVPYEYGPLPTFGIGTWQQKLTGASFDVRDNRLTISAQYGGSPRFTSCPSQHCFEVT